MLITLCNIRKLISPQACASVSADGDLYNISAVDRFADEFMFNR